MADERRGLPVEKRTGRKPVKPVRVTLACDVNGCAGYMEFTGEAFTQWDTTYTHQCSMCSIREGLVNQKFPRIEHVE